MNKFWKIYFYVFVAVAVVEYGLRIGVSYAIADGCYLSKTNIFDLAVMVVGITGLFGFTFEKRIFKKQIWGILAVGFLFNVLYEIYNFITTSTEGNEALLGGIGIIIIIPFYIAIFSYALKSEHIWGNETAR